jgi:5,10-methenyltetrahydromethanopterin hydrogenase
VVQYADVVFLVLQDAFVLCRVTKRSDWALENDNEVGDRNPHHQQQIDAATSIVKPEDAATAVVNPEDAATSVVKPEDAATSVQGNQMMLLWHPLLLIKNLQIVVMNWKHGWKNCWILHLHLTLYLILVLPSCL